MTYAGLADRVDERRVALGAAPRLVLLEASNDLETVTTLLACLAGGHPVLVASPGSTGLVDAYDPDVVARGPDLAQRRAGSAHSVHPDLALLLSTSGSTGSPRLVRLSIDNLDCNAGQIADALDLGPDDVGTTTLPLQYCYGLSVLLSHLGVGARVLLTDLSVVDACFWDAFAAAGGTTLAGVPYTFDLLDAVGFASMDLPRLRLLTQAGGRMEPATVRRWAELGEERGFGLAVMYGQTEATARIATLPVHLARTHPASVGVAVRGGHLRVEPLPAHEDAEAGRGAGVGELVYTGGNVMMGYAESPSDLARGHEVDELRTGDLARIDADGLVEIVGRRTRVAKVCGLRIDLDRVESDLADGGHAAYVMDGGDRLLVALVGGAAPGTEHVRREVGERYAVPRASVTVLAVAVDEVPRTVSGKVDRPALASRFGRRACSGPPSAADGLSAVSATGTTSEGSREEVRALYATVLDRPDATAEDSFVSLRGDSLSYVEMSVRLEGLLGALPPSWHVRPIADLVVDREEGPTVPAPTPDRRPRWRVVETSVLLRALAIAVIVLTHAGVLEVRGGAHVLLAVAGYAFARFQLAGTRRSDRVAHVLESVTRIALPSAVWVGLLVLVDDRYTGWNAALLTSVAGDDVDAQWRYWFVEALVHLLVGAAALLCVPALDRLERARPFAVPLALALAGLVPKLGLVAVGSHHLNGRPLTVLWLFALGWAMARADARWQRWLLTAYVVLVVPGTFADPARELTVAVGLLALLWLRSVRVPAFVVPLIVPLASASLFIYLVQWEVMGRVGYSALGAAAAVGAGWIVWRGSTPLVEPVARWVGTQVSTRLS